MRLAARLGKPLLLSEFGKQAGTPGSRAAYFEGVSACCCRCLSSSSSASSSAHRGCCLALPCLACTARRMHRAEARMSVRQIIPAPPSPPAAQVLSQALRLMQGGAHMAGSLFWMAAAPSYPDYDGFTIYLPPGGPALLGASAQLVHEEQQDTPPHSRVGRGPGGVLRRLASSLLGRRGASACSAPAARPSQGATQVQAAPQAQLASPQGGCPTYDGAATVIIEHAARVAGLNEQRPVPS